MQYNEGIKASSKQFIVLLSNDVVVTAEWLSGMLECNKSTRLAGVVGAITRNLNGLQNIMAGDFDSVDHLDDFAESFRKRNRFRRIPSRKISSCCMLFKRGLLKRIGFFEEGFRSGAFAAEEFCFRSALEGYGNLIAGDVFIYRQGSKRPGEYDTTFYDAAKTRDKKLFAEKWGGMDTKSPLGKKLFTINLLEKAGNAYNKGEIDACVDMLLGGIGHCPDDQRLYHRLSEILIDAGQYKDALDVLNQMKPDQQDLEWLELTGYCKAGMGLIDEAEKIVEDVLFQNESSPSALNLKGMLVWEQGENAESFFENAIAADPGYSEPYTNLGTMKWNNGRKQEALNLFEKGFVLSPKVTKAITSYHTAIASL
jgi:tetratricopeptide (TPR) repeat protein